VRFIASSGPNRIAKLAMKRKNTKTTWIQSCGWLARNPIRSKIQPTVPRYEPPRASQAIVKNEKSQIETLNQKRQNQTRRRLTTSSSRSCWLSEPNRLGHGIARRNSRSTSPRKAITRKKVPTSDQRTLQPLTSWNQT
jgi:hypothetical protein